MAIDDSIFAQKSHKANSSNIYKGEEINLIDQKLSKTNGYILQRQQAISSPKPGPSPNKVTPKNQTQTSDLSYLTKIMETCLRSQDSN